MNFKLIIVTLCFTYISITRAEDISFEYKGISVQAIGIDGKKQEMIVKRHIPDACKSLPINNEMLWTGNYAHKSVPEACKSTYVHTKGKLLPMTLDEELETYGELEVLASLKDMQIHSTTVLIDARKEQWFKYRTIPGSVNMPFYYFKEREDYEFHFEYALKYLGVKVSENKEYDFTNANTLVIFCNGPWCSQSPTMIYALRAVGYPAEKLKWYRGGMQDWLGAGMTTTRN